MTDVKLTSWASGERTATVQFVTTGVDIAVEDITTDQLRMMAEDLLATATYLDAENRVQVTDSSGRKHW